MAGAFTDGASVVIIDDFTNSGSTLFGCAQARCAEMHREIAGDRGRSRERPLHRGRAIPCPRGHPCQILRGRLGADSTVSAFVAHFVAGYTQEKARGYT